MSHSTSSRYLYIRFEFFIAVKMSMVVIWIFTPCGLVGGYQCPSELLVSTYTQLGRLPWTRYPHFIPSFI